VSVLYNFIVKKKSYYDDTNLLHNIFNLMCQYNVILV